MKTGRTCVRVSLSLLLAVGAVACSTINVTYDYDREVDFTALKSYEWLSVPPEAQADGITVKRIQNAVDRELTARGFTRTPKDSDFHIAIYGDRVTKVNVVDRGYRGYSYGPYQYQRHYWPEERRMDVYTYEEGTLILDFVHARENELIWRGTATAVIDPYASPEQRDKTINEAVGKMLENFPPNQIR